MQETHLNCKDAVCCPTEPTLGSAGIPALGSVGDVDVEPVGLVLESDMVVESRQSKARSERRMQRLQKQTKKTRLGPEGQENEWKGPRVENARVK